MTRRAMAGFTLLEILVVLVIIGVLVGMVSLNIGRARGDELQAEAQRLQALMTLVSQQALMQGQEYSVRFTPDGYAFLRLTADGWRAVDDDKVLRARRLPSAMRLQLTVEGLAVNLADERKQGQVYLLSSGELTPFQLVLRSAEGDELQLQGWVTGQVQVSDARV